MEIYPIDFVLHIINIIVLFVIVRNLAYKPIRKFMLAREERIKAEMEGAVSAKAEAESMKAEYAAGIANAEKEKAEIVAKAYTEMAAEKERLIAEAKQTADGIVTSAGQKAEALKVRAMNDAQAELAQTAVALAGKVLCFDEAARTRAMAMNTTLNGETTATVKTAGALDAEGLAEVQKCLENLCGKHLTITVQQDASLLGGFVGFVDGQVYDFSYAAQLSELQRTLG